MNAQIQLALWTAHPVLQLGVAAILYWRKLHRTFPIFFYYLLFQVLNFCVVFPAYRYGTYQQYFYSYWGLQAVSLALGFKIIHEIFLDVFRPYHALKDLGSVLFKWAALVMMLVAIVVAAASPTTQQGPIVQAVITVQRCVRVSQCGLILFLLVFSKYLGVSWRQHSFGISLGFGGFAGAELLMIALNASSNASQVTVAIVNMLAYNGAVLLWLGYAWLKSPARENPANLLMSQRWNQSLGDLQQPLPADSLIPMFEGMVDRAFSRTNGDVSCDEIPAEPAPQAARAAGAASGASVKRQPSALSK
ncbi:MAG TPA: hypothetical protein VFA68_12115 [Terriglobales bacterium]|nr:hypothetical protein [Terriglobales bacterium]